jgi:hypothetical protein
MERAFTSFSNNHKIIVNDNINLVNQKKEESTKNRIRRYGIVHPLVGRIDPYDVVNYSNLQGDILPLRQAA